MIVTEQQVEQALRYLAETDEEYGRAYGRVEGAHNQHKAIKAVAFLEATGTVAEREAKSLTADTVKAAANAYENAVAERETIRAKRKRAELIVEVYRTVSANQRRGNV